MAASILRRVPRRPNANNPPKKQSSDGPRAAAPPIDESQSWLERMSARPRLVLIIAFLMCTLPFVARPFHLDDPMYIWAAQHIVQHPTDFYGFDVIWAATKQPMSEIMQNPPLASYFIAIVGSVLGFGEVTLHLAFLLPALGVVLGTHQLAKGFCRTPLLAALITLVTPVFLVSSLTIMCDMLMVCFWVWAVVLSRQGLASGRALPMVIAAMLCGLSALSKYYGICLIPLLAAYTLMQPGRRKMWALLLIVPALMLLAYEMYTSHLYGTGLLAGAAKHAADARVITRARPEAKTLTGLSFVGGCLAVALWLSPWLWSRRWLLLGAAMAGILVVLADAALPHMAKVSDATYEFGWLQFAQVGVWASVGLGVAALSVSDLWRHRNADSLLLAMWITGTFVFACFINWSINGRSILPMAPAVAILTARRLEERATADDAWRDRWLAASLVVSALFSMALVWADTTMATSARNAARIIAEKYRPQTETLWFQGHWGFQHYMQAHDGTIMDFAHTRLPPRDVLVVPRNNVNCRPIPEPYASPIEFLSEPTFSWFSTMNMATGAGFYSDTWGPLPFAIGGKPEQYGIFRMNYGLEPFGPEEAASMSGSSGVATPAAPAR